MQQNIDLKKHTHLLGLLNVIYGMMGIFAALICFLVLSGSGLLTGDSDAGIVLLTVGTLIAVLITVLSLPSIIAGYGMMKLYGWSRIFVLILSFLHLLSFPLGTALGVYGMWVLFKPETTQFYEQHNRNNMRR